MSHHTIIVEGTVISGYVTPTDVMNVTGRDRKANVSQSTISENHPRYRQFVAALAEHDKRCAGC